MTKPVFLLFCLALLACSETVEEPDPIPTISMSDKARGWGSRKPGQAPTHIFRDAWLTLESDIPMPADTYILVDDRLVLICEGHTKSLHVFYWRVCQAGGPFSSLEPEIRPMEERARHLPYNRDGIELTVGYRFNPYKVGELASIHLGTWCP